MRRGRSGLRILVIYATVREGEDGIRVKPTSCLKMNSLFKRDFDEGDYDVLSRKYFNGMDPETVDQLLKDTGFESPKMGKWDYATMSQHESVLRHVAKQLAPAEEEQQKKTDEMFKQQAFNDKTDLGSEWSSFVDNRVNAGNVASIRRVLTKLPNLPPDGTSDAVVTEMRSFLRKLVDSTQQADVMREVAPTKDDVRKKKKRVAAARLYIELADESIDETWHTIIIKVKPVPKELARLTWRDLLSSALLCLDVDDDQHVRSVVGLIIRSLERNKTLRDGLQEIKGKQDSKALDKLLQTAIRFRLTVYAGKWNYDADRDRMRLRMLVRGHQAVADGYVAMMRSTCRGDLQEEFRKPGFFKNKFDKMHPQSKIGILRLLCGSSFNDTEPYYCSYADYVDSLEVVIKDRDTPRAFRKGLLELIIQGELEKEHPGLLRTFLINPGLLRAMGPLVGSDCTKRLVKYLLNNIPEDGSLRNAHVIAFVTLVNTQLPNKSANEDICAYVQTFVQQNGVVDELNAAWKNEVIERIASKVVQGQKGDASEDSSLEKILRDNVDLIGQQRKVALVKKWFPNGKQEELPSEGATQLSISIVGSSTPSILDGTGLQSEALLTAVLNSVAETSAVQTEGRNATAFHALARFFALKNLPPNVVPVFETFFRKHSVQEVFVKTALAEDDVHSPRWTILANLLQHPKQFLALSSVALSSVKRVHEVLVAVILGASYPTSFLNALKECAKSTRATAPLKRVLVYVNSERSKNKDGPAIVIRLVMAVLRSHKPNDYKLLAAICEYLSRDVRIRYWSAGVNDFVESVVYLRYLKPTGDILGYCAGVLQKGRHYTPKNMPVFVFERMVITILLRGERILGSSDETTRNALLVHFADSKGDNVEEALAELIRSSSLTFKALSNSLLETVVNRLVNVWPCPKNSRSWPAAVEKSKPVEALVKILYDCNLTEARFEMLNGNGQQKVLEVLAIISSNDGLGEMKDKTPSHEECRELLRKLIKAVPARYGYIRKDIFGGIAIQDEEEQCTFCQCTNSEDKKVFEFKCCMRNLICDHCLREKFGKYERALQLTCQDHTIMIVAADGILTGASAILDKTDDLLTHVQAEVTLALQNSSRRATLLYLYQCRLRAFLKVEWKAEAGCWSVRLTKECADPMLLYFLGLCGYEMASSTLEEKKGIQRSLVRRIRDGKYSAYEMKEASISHELEALFVGKFGLRLYASDLDDEITALRRVAG